MEFVWDSKKAAGNLRDHRISFQEAATVLGDPLAVTYSDPDHSNDESRFITIGLSVRGNLLIIAHTDRADAIRLISAREVTRGEKELYEEES